MKPEDFGITKYKILSSGKLEIDQNVDMRNKELTDFPFDVEIIHGKLDLSENKITSLKNIPLKVRELLLNKNMIMDISDLNKGSDCLYSIYLSKNFIKNIELDNSKLPKLNNFVCLTNDIEKIKLNCNNFYNGLLAINVLKDFSQLPKFIKDLTIGRLTKDEKTEFNQFKEIPSVLQQLQLSNLYIKNFEGLYNSQLRITLYSCILENIDHLPPFSSLSFYDTLIKELNLSKPCFIEDIG